jgi:hypothetical protein
MIYFILYTATALFFWISFLEAFINDKQICNDCKEFHPLLVLLVIGFLSIVWPFIVIKELIQILRK